MSEINESISISAHTPSSGLAAPAQELQALEDQICELAGHLAAATCRFLLLVADFDARRGWATWDLPSCGAWLAWKCQIAPGTAREHVRVARALPALPAIRAAFAAGTMSYAKVRALTRIATPATDAGLAELAGPMTAGRERDGARCQFPGCNSRRTDIHHIRHWAHGGPTRLDNLILLCEAHHVIVHERGYLIAPAASAGFAFTRPDGIPVPASPHLPPTSGDITGWHDATITSDTIIPNWNGDKLDLDHAIWVAFANARLATAAP
jgi:hypothetical protein